jgi:hypothetical protein
MADGWSRKQRRELRNLQGLAWERELEEALRSLRKDFEMWDRGDISAFELSDRIHKFHNGRSRELFNMYSGSLDNWWVGHSIARGVIEESELSDDLRNVLKDGIAVCRARQQVAGGSADSN